MSSPRYIRMNYAALVNDYFTYVTALTVFTSSLKFCRLLSFHRAFMQISATIDLCFRGLSTFFVEFAIVFIAFTAFFYFTVKNDLENFRDFIRSLENTMAMSIGKFNFSALRASDELAAWIFFIFSGNLQDPPLSQHDFWLSSRYTLHIFCSRR